MARLFGYKALWRMGVGSAGRRLLAALDSPQPDVRTIAGMFLVQAGKRAEPLVRHALDQGRHLPIILTISADLGAQDLAPQIAHFATNADPRIAQAARDALAILATQKESPSGNSAPNR